MYFQKENQLVGIVDIGNSWINFSVYTTNGATMFSRSIFILARQARLETIVATMRETVVYFLGKTRNRSFVLAGAEAEDKNRRKDLIIKNGEVVKGGPLFKEIHTYGAIGRLAHCSSSSRFIST